MPCGRKETTAHGLESPTGHEPKGPINTTTTNTAAHSLLYDLKEKACTSPFPFKPVTKKLVKAPTNTDFMRNLGATAKRQHLARELPHVAL